MLERKSATILYFGNNLKTTERKNGNSYSYTQNIRG